jgi:hypothetical protein
MKYFIGGPNSHIKHTNDINAFLDQVKTLKGRESIIKFWLDKDVQSKSDVYSIGLVLLHISGRYNILKSKDEQQDVIYYREDDKGPYVLREKSVKRLKELEVKIGKTIVKSINVRDAFNTLMQGLLWHDPLNRFSIEKALVWVKLIKQFPHQDPFKTNKDAPSLLRDMRSRLSTASLSNTTLDDWFQKLQSKKVKPVLSETYITPVHSHPVSIQHNSLLSNLKYTRHRG